MFKPKPPKLAIVEIKGAPSLALNADGRKSLETLKAHPGFQYLIEKLRLQRAALESQLVNQTHQDIKEVYWIQSGIRWMNWIENQFLLAVNHPSGRKPRDPNAEEMEALEQALQAIQGVGDK